MATRTAQCHLGNALFFRKAWVKLSQSGIFPPTFGYELVYCTEADHMFQLMDVNGDGKMDLVCRRKYQENWLYVENTHNVATV